MWKGRKGSLWDAKEMAVAMLVKQARDGKHTQEMTWTGHRGQSTARAELGECHRAGQGNTSHVWKKGWVPTGSIWVEERAEMTEGVDKVIVFKYPISIFFATSRPYSPVLYLCLTDHIKRCVMQQRVPENDQHLSAWCAPLIKGWQ